MRAGRARRGRRPTRSARSGRARRRGAPDSARAGAPLCPRLQARRGGTAPPSHRRAAAGRLPGPLSTRLLLRAAGRSALTRRRRTSAGARGAQPPGRASSRRTRRRGRRLSSLGAHPNTSREARRLAPLRPLSHSCRKPGQFSEPNSPPRRVRHASLDRIQAAVRAARIRHERSRLSVACSSASSPTSRAPTTRKWRGRKSSIVLPSRYCSTTAGLT